MVLTSGPAEDLLKALIATSCSVSLRPRPLEAQPVILFLPPIQMSSKRSSSFRRAIANGRRTLQREILLDETGLGLYKRFVRYVAYEILPCETDRRWYFHQNRLCPPPVFIAVVTVVQVSVGQPGSSESRMARLLCILPCGGATSSSPAGFSHCSQGSGCSTSETLKRFSAFDQELLL